MILVQVIQTLSCVVVLALGLLALNRMSHETRHAVRWSYVALVAGALGGLESCFASRDIFECLFAAGVALYLVCNRREAFGEYTT